MTNNVIVTKAKKDNAIIIIKEEEYGNKINQFFLQTLLKTIKIRHTVNKMYVFCNLCIFIVRVYVFLLLSMFS